MEETARTGEWIIVISALVAALIALWIGVSGRWGYYQGFKDGQKDASKTEQRGDGERRRRFDDIG